MSVSAPDLAQAWLEHSPFARVLGIRLEQMDTDVATVALPYDDSIATYGDVVHGGAIGTLVDVAAACAAWSAATVSDSPKGATIGLTVDFLRAARGTDVHATARVIRRGGSVSFCEVDVTADDELVAKGLVTYTIR